MNNTIDHLPDSVKNRKDLDIRTGDTVRVHVKIIEKGKTRIQIFEGLVLARKHGKEAGATITVRKVSSGVGVERVFPLYSPNIDKIEVVKRSRVKRSKLYYIRTKVARSIRRKLRNFVQFFTSTDELVPVETMEEEVEEVKEPNEEVVTEETPTEEKETKEEKTPQAEPTEEPQEKEEEPASEEEKTE